MKTVYIVRHGKAIPASANIADADRLLTDTGVARTWKIAEYMTESMPVIDQIIASPAERAYATALIIADKLGVPANKVVSHDKLFTGDEMDALDLIEGLDDSINSVMIVGHNPVITMVANRFASPKLESLPTTGVVSVHLDTDKWVDLKKAKVIQNFTVWPGML
ncbi:MAG: histidine phosphatase family protein [Lentimicrobiaceae bacterium]